MDYKQGSSLPKHWRLDLACYIVRPNATNFSSTARLLVTSGWKYNVRMYELETNLARHTFDVIFQSMSIPSYNPTFLSFLLSSILDIRPHGFLRVLCPKDNLQNVGP
jgi:hypothetical protein